MSTLDFPWPQRVSAVVYNDVSLSSFQSWGELLERDTGTVIRIAIEPDIVNRFRWLKYGLFHLGAGFTNETSKMLQGNGQFATRDGGPFPVRLVWPYSQSSTGFFTRGDSPIRTPRDIKPGVRMVHMGYAPGLAMFHALFAWAGVDPEDIVKVPSQSVEETVSLIAEARADICFGNPTTRTAQGAAKNPHGISWIELNPNDDPEGASRFSQAYPLISFGPMPEGGVPSSVGIWSMLGTNFIITRESTSPELVYYLVRWLDENQPRYRDKHPDNRVRHMGVLTEGLNHTFIPCHKGVIQYLEDRGLWTEAHRRRHQQNIATISRYCQAYQEALDMADERLIKLDPQNQEWLKLWEGYKKDKGLPSFRLFTSLDED